MSQFSSSHTLQGSPQISYAAFGLLPGKVFTGLFLPCLDLQTFPSPHIWQVFSVSPSIFYRYLVFPHLIFDRFLAFHHLMFDKSVCIGQFQFQQISLVFITGLFVPRLGGLCANIPPAHLR